MRKFFLSLGMALSLGIASTYAESFETPEPEWVMVEPLRKVENTSVLADIDSHMPEGHIYRAKDLCTWGHETSHGITSRLRKIHNKTTDPRQPFPNINAFYLLENRAIVFKEPPTYLHKIAANVPLSLRGDMYENYLIKQQHRTDEQGRFEFRGGWDNAPLYVFDEWVAYTNGSAVKVDYKITEKNGTVDHMTQFNV